MARVAVGNECVIIPPLRRSYADGFWIAPAGDSTIILYTVAYFAVCGFKTPCEIDRQ